MKIIFTLLLLIIFGCLIPAKAQNINVPIVTSEAGSPSGFSPRFMGTVELGFLYGKMENPWGNPPTYLASPAILLFNGIQLHRLFAIGAVTGFDFYENILITPIGMGIRGTFLNTRVSPYYSLDGGYGSSFLSGKGNGERPDGGWFINPALGMRVAVDHKTAFLFSLGYKQQRTETENTGGWGNSTIKQRITYKRLSLRIGFMF